MNKSSKKLTKLQKRAAMHIAAGLTAKKVAKIIDKHYMTVVKWKALPAFKNRVARINRVLSEFVEQKQLVFMEKAYKKLDMLLDSAKTDAVMFAIEQIFKINNRYPATGKFIHEHQGTIVQDHQGDVHIDTKQLEPDVKDNIKKLLKATRPFISTSN